MFSRVISNSQIQWYSTWNKIHPSVNILSFGQSSLIRSESTLVKLKTDQKELKDAKIESLTEEQQFLVKLQKDPNVFGTPEGEIVDKGDIEEELHISEGPRRSVSVKIYADMIKSYIKQRKIKEAFEVLEIKMLKQDRVKPVGYIYSLLIGSCGRVGYTKKAFSLYNDMKKRGFNVTGGVYTALFNACANSPWPEDGLKRAKHLRNIMVEKMYEPNDSNYNAMIKAFGRCGDLATAFEVVDEMISKKFQLKDDTINFLLQACITDKETGFRHALLVWRKMIKLKIKPSFYTYNLMLRTIRDCNLGDIEVTQNLISQILPETQSLINDSNKLMLEEPNEKALVSSVETSLVVNSISSTQVPNLMAKLPHLGNLISLSEVMKPEEKLLLVGGINGFLDNMKENSCEPNIKTFTQLLDVIPNTIAAENELLSSIKKFNVKCDVDFFNMLIKKRSMRSDYQGAKDVLKMLKKRKMLPNLITYGVLAIGCSTKEEALKLIGDMKEARYRLNPEILGTMLHQACYHNNIPYVLEILKLSVEEDVHPNKTFIDHLEKFKTKCRRMIKYGNDELGQSQQFQKDFGEFRKRYNNWLKEVKPEDSENTHPWEQFKQSTDPKTDKYYKDKDSKSRFKARHTSKFKVKTSAAKINST